MGTHGEASDETVIKGRWYRQADAYIGVLLILAGATGFRSQLGTWVVVYVLLVATGLLNVVEAFTATGAVVSDDGIRSRWWRQRRRFAGWDRIDRVEVRSLGVRLVLRNGSKVHLAVGPSEVRLVAELLETERVRRTGGPPRP